MTDPAVAVLRVVWGLAVGAILGICYDFLRPLRRRYNTPADVIFSLAALYGWIWYSFRICDGDIRMGGTLSLGIGILLWLCTGSFVCRKVFYWFWLVIFQILSVLFLPFRKTFKIFRLFLKKVFAYGKKRGYNKKSNRNPSQTSGGVYYE